MSKEGGGRGGYYSCGRYRVTKSCQRNAYSLVKLDQEVAAYLFRVLRSEDIFKTIRSQQHIEHLSELKAESSRLQKLLGEFAQRKHRLFDLYEAGHITEEEFAERKEEHEREHRAYEQALGEKREQLAKLESEEISRETFRQVLDSIEDRWEQCDFMERKRKLGALMEKIVLRDGGFRVYFRLSF